MPLADRGAAAVKQRTSNSRMVFLSTQRCGRVRLRARLRNFLRLVAIVRLRELVPNQHLANLGGVKASSGARNLSLSRL
jgi:hypothetical protein